MAAGAGWLGSRLPDKNTQEVKREYQPKNPLEVRVASLFALLYLGMLIATNLAVVYLGTVGVYSLAAVLGAADVDPFIMGMTHSAGRTTSLAVAASAIAIAAASNNVVKGVYAYSLSDRQTGVQSVSLLLGLAALGLVPLLWLAA